LRQRRRKWGLSISQSPLTSRRHRLAGVGGW
jgi:hypothetical protein